MNQNAKIIATLGPTSSNETIIEKMIIAGMDVARLNFSHGTYEEHSNKIKLLRNLSQKLKKPITILQDLQGPKLRVGSLPPDGIPLETGQIVHLKRLFNNKFTGAIDSSDLVIPLDIPDVTCDLVKGERILLDDGTMELIILNVDQDEIDAKVIIGGILLSHKGVNLPGISLNIPGFTEKDQADLQFGLSQGIDALAISFVRSASDINIIRKSILHLSPKDSLIPIIAKLELPEAIHNLDQILDAADGVMVARGDLAVETSPSAVPVIQKEIIHAANLKAKLVITATQMLDSMIKNPRPTRAEASDVANAILDGTDAVMLSGETASGAYPVESVAMMNSIVQEAEAHFKEWGHTFTPESQSQMEDPLALAFAARELAHDSEVACIAVFTQTGRSARFISKIRPEVPILAFTPVEKTYQRFGLYWGIIPYLVPFSATLKEMISHVEKAIVATTSFHSGQKVVIISGFPVDAIRPANMALLHTIGQE